MATESARGWSGVAVGRADGGFGKKLFTKAFIVLHDSVLESFSEQTLCLLH